MIDPELSARLDEMRAKIDAIDASVQKMRKYAFWRTVITIAFIVLPIIGLSFVIPQFIANYTDTLQGLGL